MILDITQYGYPDDETPDTLTEEGFGEWDNKLTPDGCALTDEARDALARQSGLAALPRLCWLRVDFKNGTVPLLRQWQDRAPEQGKDPKAKFYVKNPLRLDLYLPGGRIRSLPDYAEVQLVTV